MNSAGFPDYVIQNNDASAVIPFNIGNPDANGCYWYMNGELNGWDSPDMRVTMLPRQGSDPGADGEIPADLHYRGRTLQFKLMASCPSEAARESSRLLLAKATDLLGGPSGTGLFLANEEVPKQLVIVRSGNSGQGKLTMTDAGFSAPGAPSTAGFPVADADSDGNIYLLEADIELYASDPRKYSQAEQTATLAGGTTTLSPIGNTATQNMAVNITNGISGMDITVDLTIVGAVTMVLTVPTLPSSAPAPGNFPGILHVDAYNKRITSGSGDNYYYLRDLRYPWLYLPYGGPYTFNLTGGLGDSDGSTVVWRDAWI